MLGAIDADAALAANPELVDVIVATSAAALLSASTRDATQLLENRLVGAAQDERTRTSRDLQSGVLQRLVAMRTRAAVMPKETSSAVDPSSVSPRGSMAPSLSCAGRSRRPSQP